MAKPLQELKCNRCTYEWLPRIRVTPKKCPRCGSPYWQSFRSKEYGSLSSSDKRKIISLRKRGLSFNSIAQELGGKVVGETVRKAYGKVSA